MIKNQLRLASVLAKLQADAVALPIYDGLSPDLGPDLGPDLRPDLSLMGICDKDPHWAPPTPPEDKEEEKGQSEVRERKKRHRPTRRERRLRKWAREKEAATHVLEESPVAYDFMPEFLLERILVHIPMRDRLRTALVCREWHAKQFCCARTWPVLHIAPNDFTKSKHNRYRKSGRGANVERFYLCLQSVGHYIQHLIIDPNSEMHVLYELLRVLKEYVASHFFEEFDDSTAFPRLQSFEYTHTPVKVVADAMTSRARRRQAYGNLVGLEDEGAFETVRTIVHGVRFLKRLVLKNLFIGDLQPLRTMMDSVITQKCHTLEYLDITNFVKTPIESLWFPVFHNLKTLVITTNFFCETLLAEIGATSIRHLVLDHDSFTSPFQNSLVEEAWMNLKQSNPYIRVTLLSTDGKQDVIHQDQAPVSSIIYKSEKVGLDSMNLMSHVHDYCDTLEILAQEGLVKYRVAKSFHDRVDMNLAMLVRSSTCLHTLALRERVSTATLLVLASSAKCLKRLYVRRNAVIKRSDWARRRNIQSAALSYEETEREIGKCLGDPNWKMLTDKEYKKLKFHWTDTISE